MSSLADFTARVKGDVITPGHPEYKKSLRRWAVNAEQDAAVIVFVKDEADVSAAVLYARENNLPIAIRGGGHNPTGASSVEGGLVIDLSRYLDGVVVNPEKRLAYVGGGALWETVDKTAIEHGLATVGGTVNHTGVGGLILGGGFGWLSGEYGLTIDNLIQVTLVSADGSVHTANEKENADLYFGVRGGGCNFGVVTEFVLTLYPQRRTIFAGPVIFSDSKLAKVVEFARDWYAGVDPKEAMLMVTSCEPGKDPMIVCFVFYNGSEEEGRGRFKKLYDIGPSMDMSKEVPYEILNSVQNSFVVPGSGIYWKGVAHEGPAHKPIAEAYEKAQELTKGGNFVVNIVYEWIPLQKINTVASNKTAYRRSPRPNCLVFVAWPRNAHSGEMVNDARSLAHEVAARVAGGELELKDTKSQPYANYDPEGIAGDKDEVKDKAKVAFGENYPTLQKVKKIYDPDNVFNRWFAITPA